MFLYSEHVCLLVPRPLSGAHLSDPLDTREGLQNHTHWSLPRLNQMKMGTVQQSPNSSGVIVLPPGTDATMGSFRRGLCYIQSWSTLALMFPLKGLARASLRVLQKWPKKPSSPKMEAVAACSSVNFHICLGASGHRREDGVRRGLVGDPRFNLRRLIAFFSIFSFLKILFQ